MEIRNRNRHNRAFWPALGHCRLWEKPAGPIGSGKSKCGISNGGLRPLCAICAQSSTIMHICDLLGSIFHQLLQNDDNCRQSLTIVDKYLKPPFVEPQIDFPDRMRRELKGCNFLLTVGSVLLTAELFCLQLCFQGCVNRGSRWPAERRSN